jgi:hypothetical protein
VVPPFTGIVTVDALFWTDSFRLLRYVVLDPDFSVTLQITMSLNLNL